MRLIDFFPGFQGPRRRVLLAVIVVLSGFPFLLKTGIDSEVVRNQAVVSIYRSWRFSEGVRDLNPGSGIVFERRSERSAYEEALQSQLQKDFRLIDARLADSKTPRVRSFFTTEGLLRARLELWPDRQAPEPFVWEGARRFVNNGILLGSWLSILFWLLGWGPRKSLLLGAAATLFWYSDWNLLAIPGLLVAFFVDFFTEIFARIFNGNWNAGELGRLAELGGVLWAVLLGVFWIFDAKTGARAKPLRFLLATLLLEPFILYFGSRFGNWGPEASWWKVYLGSLAFRFVTGAHLFFYFLRPKLFEAQVSSGTKRSYSSGLGSRASILLPLVFLISGGWEWLHSVLNPGLGDILLQLKVFLMGFVISLCLGSRVFSLWLGMLVVSILLQPTKGHWIAAGFFGVLMDGLLLGWWVTPLKGFHLGFMRDESGQHWSRRFVFVSVMAWIVGTLFSSVGAPLGIVWAALGLGVWAYSQLTTPIGKLAQTA